MNISPKVVERVRSASKENRDPNRSGETKPRPRKHIQATGWALWKLAYAEFHEEKQQKIEDSNRKDGEKRQVKFADEVEVIPRSPRPQKPINAARLLFKRRRQQENLQRLKRVKGKSHFAPAPRRTANHFAMGHICGTCGTFTAKQKEYAMHRVSCTGSQSESMGSSSPRTSDNAQHNEPHQIGLSGPPRYPPNQQEDQQPPGYDLVLERQAEAEEQDISGGSSQQDRDVEDDLGPPPQRNPLKGRKLTLRQFLTLPREEQLKKLESSRAKILDGTSPLLKSLPRETALARIAKIKEKILNGTLEEAQPVEKADPREGRVLQPAKESSPSRDDPFSLPFDSPYNPFHSFPNYNPYAELEPEPTNKWEPTGPGGPLVETIEFARWIRESALREGIVPHIPGRPPMTAEQYREISARPDMSREDSPQSDNRADSAPPARSQPTDDSIWDHEGRQDIASRKGKERVDKVVKRKGAMLTVEEVPPRRARLPKIYLINKHLNDMPTTRYFRIPVAASSPEAVEDLVALESALTRPPCPHAGRELDPLRAISLRPGSWIQFPHIDHHGKQYQAHGLVSHVDDLAGIVAAYAPECRHIQSSPDLSTPICLFFKPQRVTGMASTHTPGLYTLPLRLDAPVLSPYPPPPNLLAHFAKIIPTINPPVWEEALEDLGRFDPGRIMLARTYRVRYGEHAGLMGFAMLSQMNGLIDLAVNRHGISTTLKVPIGYLGTGYYPGDDVGGYTEDAEGGRYEEGSIIADAGPGRYFVQSNRQTQGHTYILLEKNMDHIYHDN
ncbi:hypothetical protein DFP72DRAFT_851681 [Ephemerocybe angulata]|uniref:Uncharacterized protein n=1 Tax=Ephemerocybe angulata TaxID=980116 RepID=A0A8H6M173_9AGAR|nr:hypothetical protein DFP72DRAFT_851681 [Tulosesus angulatus]